MKKLKERGSSTIKRAVESLNTPQEAFVENIGEVAVAVEKPVREKTQTINMRVSEKFQELMKTCAQKHNIAQKSFVQLSALSMRSAGNEQITQAWADLLKADVGPATERATFKSSAKFTELVIPDLASRFNGNISLAFKASAAYVAALPEEEAAALIREAIQVDLRMGYRLTAPFR